MASYPRGFISINMTAKSPLGLRRPDDREAPYYCGLIGTVEHRPVHGETHSPGEKHMRADNCIYCTQRIVSLNVHADSWDKWRAASTVRPSMLIEEEPW